MEFKDRLVQLRKEKNLNQENFAKKIGYTRTAISAWEVGRNEPSNADTIKIADFFGVSTDYLLGKSNLRTIEQEFKFKYQKEMEGLTEEEISTALKIYKEMKKNLNNKL